MWQRRVPGQLGAIVNNRLNKTLEEGCYLYAGLEASEKAIWDIPIVKQFLEGSG